MTVTRLPPLPTTHRARAAAAALLAAVCLIGTASVAEARSTVATSTPGYWTPERMREAVRNAEGASGEALARASGPGNARPVPAGLGMQAIGRVFSVLPNGTPYACSGTLVESANQSVVWTAGHCLHRGRGRGWHTNVSFVPNYQPQASGNPAPHGIWPAARVAVNGGWPVHGITRTSRRLWKVAQFDGGGLVLARDAAGRVAADALGVAHDIRFGVRRSSSVRLIGYPAKAPYLGERAMQCGPSRTRRRSYAKKLLAVPCQLGQGMSGGPALIRMNRFGVGVVIGQTTASDFRRHMFFAYQGRAMQRVYRQLSRWPV